MIDTTIIQALSNMSLGALSVLLGYGMMYIILSKVIEPHLFKLSEEHRAIIQKIDDVKDEIIKR